MDIRVKRAYDEPASDDGVRVLVDRIWPRGVSKDDLALDGWVKDVAPSSDLRKWFGHDPKKFKEFRDRYRDELDDDTHTAALEELRDLADGRRHFTLVTATKDVEHSHVVVLRDALS